MSGLQDRQLSVLSLHSFEPLPSLQEESQPLSHLQTVMLCIQSLQIRFNFFH